MTGRGPPRGRPSGSVAVYPLLLLVSLDRHLSTCSVVCDPPECHTLGVTESPRDEPQFSYVIRLGAGEDCPAFDVDLPDDLAVGRFASFVLSRRLVVPFADGCEVVLAAGSEVRGLVVEKDTPADLLGEDTEGDVAEAAFRVVGEATGGH